MLTLAADMGTNSSLIAFTIINVSTMTGLIVHGSMASVLLWLFTSHHERYIR